MANILKICAVALTSAAIAACASAAYCEEGETKVFRGTVQEIDWVGSLLTVTGIDEMTFFVPSDTKIIWGTETTGLSDLEQGDDVEVRYYNDASGTARATKIILNKAYPEF